jgi:hypothetical protein
VSVTKFGPRTIFGGSQSACAAFTLNIAGGAQYLDVKSLMFVHYIVAFESCRHLLLAKAGVVEGVP